MTDIVAYRLAANAATASPYLSEGVTQTHCACPRPPASQRNTTHSFNKLESGWVVACCCWFVRISIDIFTCFAVNLQYK